MNQCKAGGLNNASHCLGQLLVFVELFLLLTTCFSFRFLYLDYNIAHPLNDTQALRRHCEPLLAGWQWALFCPVMTTTNAMSQHKHPACEPLLVGRYGGADDDDQEGERQMMGMTNDGNNQWWEQPMTANDQWQRWTNNRERPTVGNHRWQGTMNGREPWMTRNDEWGGITNNREPWMAGNNKWQGMTMIGPHRVLSSETCRTPHDIFALHSHNVPIPQYALDMPRSTPI